MFALRAGARRAPAVAARGARRFYKTVVSPKAVDSHPELSKEELMVVKQMAEERKTNELEDTAPSDPTTLFLQEGRYLLAHIEDGGDVRVVKDTGVPGVFVLEIDNAAHDNCFTAHMMVRLEDCIREINRHPECVAIVLRGIGVQFCSGAHAELATKHLLHADAGLKMCRYMQTLLMEFHNLPCITVAAVEGGAVGGGAELALACDFRVLSNAGNIHFAHTHMGLTTGWGGATRLTKLVGRRAAILLLCSGKPCLPEDAMSFGLADRLCDEGEAYRNALAFIKANFLQAPPEAVKGCKDIVAAAEILSPRTALIYEQNVFASLWARNARKHHQAVSPLQQNKPGSATMLGKDTPSASSA
eukprot:Rhum_TRINITY_DN297_c0_g1::Rhum_TRINITY_DN297_c0_g1_i1::g.1024::m.1024/K18426/ECHDC1; ethylmalonyl-CoA/methylmalonyl-CoA decarboxylase